MLTFGLIAFAAAFAQFVAGQAVNPPPDTPKCLLTCAAASCPTPQQVDCVCVTEITNITTCVLHSCNAADQQTAVQVAAQICGTSLPIHSNVHRER